MGKRNIGRETEWDVIIVGTGIGGGTLGYALARAGKRVLFLEKGRSYLEPYDDLITGDYAENRFVKDEPKEGPRNRGILFRAGRYSDLINEETPANAYGFSPFLGEGSGGSSALYGMVMERLFPEDFKVKEFFKDAPGTSLPDAWPIGYDDLRPYYREAEKLYRVRGTLDPMRRRSLDPLMDPPSLSEPSRELFAFFEGKGLHPYMMPMACEYVKGCQECIGYICSRDCKNDSTRVCIAPALRDHSASMIDECQVTHLEAAEDRVTGVRCKIGDEDVRFRANLVVLAAGALHTPAILLRSKSEQWPDGLANRSGLVGKNLMRHFFDLYCVKTDAALGPDVLTKQIALNDVYYSDGHKLGTVQAVGRLASSEALVGELRDEVRRKGNPLLAKMINLVNRFARYYIENNISNRLILTAIMEDLPYEKNQVRLHGDGNGIEIQFEISSYDKKRIALFRDKVKGLLGSRSFTFVKNAENTERLAHACGTCRFGEDPKTSVLDVHNRAHGVDNLYVVDSSFFPTGSGINPSLTIAANALRVAEHILSVR